MAAIFPFRGLRYDQLRVGKLERVTAPPYDVISPSESDRYHQAEPLPIAALAVGVGA